MPYPKGARFACGQYDFTSPSTCSIYSLALSERNPTIFSGASRSRSTKVLDTSAPSSGGSTMSAIACAAIFSSEYSTSYSFSLLFSSVKTKASLSSWVKLHNSIQGKQGSYLSGFSYYLLPPRGLDFFLWVLSCPSPSSRHPFSGARFVEYFLISTSAIDCGPPDTCLFYPEVGILSPQAAY